MERRRIEFSGRVQGVGFRATARDTASGHTVTGWVRNDPDGVVLMEVQGEPAAIDAYLADLRARLGRLISREVAATIAADAQERGFGVRH
jgi:acylphosphatase